jgi:hypothetical protein
MVDTQRYGCPLFFFTLLDYIIFIFALLLQTIMLLLLSKRQKERELITVMQTE